MSDSLIDSPKSLVVLNGVNLDLLGERPAAHYGTITLPELERSVSEEAERLGWVCVCRQTNHEGQYVEHIHEFRHAGALLVNPGAWTHYSYAIRDALEVVTCPIGEVHLSDISSREEWRRISVISPVATFTIAGKGPDGYLEAARRLISLVDG
jgi:3-dehydroquinate dehydratase-2